METPAMRPASGPEPDRLAMLADDLDALSNVQRVRLLHLLTRPRYGEEIADALGMARQSALKHIQRLEERGFVRALHGRRATGPVIEYQVVPQRLFALGVAISALGGLEPEGGPAVARAESTMVFEGDGAAPASSPATTALPRHLLVLNGPRAGTRLPLGEGTDRWTIGRDPDRDLALGHDPFVSGRHAEILRSRAGFDLVDGFAANGTHINLGRLPKGARVPLRAGDVVGVGHTLLVFQEP